MPVKAKMPYTVPKRADRQQQYRQTFLQGAREILGECVTVQVAKRSELYTFKVMPQRWAVECSFK